MIHRSRSVVQRYGIVVISTALALTLTLLMPWMHHRETFLFFFGAVSLSAWFGGKRPGIIASLLAAVIQDYYIFEPTFQFSFNEAAIIPCIMFIAVSYLICLLTEGLRRAEDRAQEQRQLLQITLSSIGDAVIATDAKGVVTFLNPAAEKLTSWTATDATGRRIEDVANLTISSDIHENMSPIAEVLKNNIIIDFPSGSLLTQRNGMSFPVEGNVATIKNVEGIAMGSVLIIRDITERESARRKIMDYQQRLRSMALEVTLAAERERREIAIGLHDRVGQSLGLTRIKLGALRRVIIDPDIIEKVDDMIKLLKAMISEIRSLTFELSPPILYEFGLEAALEWLTTSVYKQHDVKCNFTVDGIQNPVKQEFGVLLFQAVRELLTNAVKHAEATQVNVALQSQDSQVRVEVSDNGIGFDTLETMRVPERHGFGLFSIRERINHLGGSFSIESAQGHGTRAILTLPV